MRIVAACLIMMLPRLATAGELSDLVGWTVVAAQSSSSTISGSVNNQVVELNNGWVFKITDYDFMYEFFPKVLVFAKQYTPEEMKRIGIKDAKDPILLYKLMIKDKALSASRLR